MCFSNTKYDPSKTEPNDRLGLTKEETAGYMAYHNGPHGPFDHIQTIGEWAKANRRGVYANPETPPPDLPADPGLKSGESYTDYKPTLAKKTSEGGEPGGAPPAPPSLTDPQLDAIRNSQMLMLKSGRGRASTFLTGPTGLPSLTSGSGMFTNKRAAPKLGHTLLGG